MKRAFFLILGLSINTHADIVHKPNPATATPAPTAAAAAPVAEGPLTDAEKKKLTIQFQKEMSTQKSALAHQERSSMKELNAAQSMKQKKWREDEKKARQQYFDQHMSGPERREYVQNYIKKKEAFDASIKAEYAAAKKSWADKSAALKTKQKEQEEALKASLAQGVRPSAEFWQQNKQ